MPLKKIISGSTLVLFWENKTTNKIEKLCWFLPNACPWLDPPKLNLGFSLALTICGS